MPGSSSLLEDRLRDRGDVRRAADGLQVRGLAAVDEARAVGGEGVRVARGLVVELEVLGVDPVARRARRGVRAERRLDHPVDLRAVELHGLDRPVLGEIRGVDDAIAANEAALRRAATGRVEGRT